MRPDPTRGGASAPIAWLDLFGFGLAVGLALALMAPAAIGASALEGPIRFLAALALIVLATLVLSLQRSARTTGRQDPARLHAANPAPTEWLEPLQRIADALQSLPGSRNQPEPPAGWLEAQLRLADTLQGLAATLSQLPAVPPAQVNAVSGPVGDDPAAAIETAIREGRWSDAVECANELARAAPDDPRAQTAPAAVERRRAEAREALSLRIEAARDANDSESVLELRAQMTALLPAAQMQEFDRDLIQWFMGQLMRRMRSGSVSIDVASLADRIATEFPASKEGASLKASLPTLRRAAGLCPRCARPYTGIEAACPECLATANATTPGPTLLAFPDDPEPVEAASGDADDLDALGGERFEPRTD